MRIFLVLLFLGVGGVEGHANPQPRNLYGAFMVIRDGRPPDRLRLHEELGNYSALIAGISPFIAQVHARGAAEPTPVASAEVAEAPTWAEPPTLKAPAWLFTAHDPSGSSEVSPNCELFLTVYSGVHGQLGRLFERTSNFPLELIHFSGEETLVAARIRVLAALAGILNMAVTNSAEGGTGILDPQHEKESCPFSDRKAWDRHAGRLNEAMDRTLWASLGIEGLRGMTAMESQLAALIEQSEQSRKYWLWGETIVATIVSIALWKFIPIIGRVLFGGSIARSRPWTLLAVRTSALTAEGLLFNYFHDHYLFKEDHLLADQRGLIIWSDVLNSIQDTLSTPLDSPKLYFDSLKQIHAKESAMMKEFLHPWQSQLQQAEDRYGSIDRAYENARKGMVNAHANP